MIVLQGIKSGSQKAKLVLCQIAGLEAGLVANAEEYLYSSAVDYCGMKGLVEVEIMEKSGYERVGL